MVSKKLIREYDFKTIEDYYNYIIDSETNGNGQAKDLIFALSKKQKVQFIEFIKTIDNSFLSKIINKVLKITYQSF